MKKGTTVAVRALTALASAFSALSCGRSLEARDAGPATVHLTGTVLVAPSGGMLAGVKICAYTHHDIPCVVSDGVGKFDALLPENSETAATFELEGYTAVIVPYATGNANIEHVGVTIPLAGDRIATYAAFGAQAPDETTGFVSAFVGTPTSPLGVPGVKIALEPNSGKGPFYFGEDGSPTLSGLATSAVSIAFFANVAPGEATLTFAGPPGLACKRSFGGWSAPGVDAVRIPVSAGFETHVAVSCVPPRTSVTSVTSVTVRDAAAPRR
jgi:hypothetical protein